MDSATVQRFLEGMKYEAARTAPPDGFPQLADIPAGRYVDPAFLALEREHLWKKSWLYVCHTEQIAQPGSFVVTRRTGAPIIIVRGKDDVIRAFYNTCRHRGGPLVKSDSGCSEGFVCGYHGWTYALDGRLLNLRDKRDFVGLNPEERALIPVRCERFFNWVFINEDPQAAPLAEHFQPFTVHFEQFQPLEWRFVAQQGFDVECNVKVLMDAFLEVYHLKSIHTNTVDRFLDHRGTTIALYRNGHSLMVTPNRRPDWVDPGTRGMRRIESATEVSARNNPSFNFFPNRMHGELFDYSLEERWIRDEALSKQMPTAIARALESAGLATSAIDHVVMTGSSANAKRVVRLAGLEGAKLQDNLRAGCGDTGAAHALLLLCAALETATPGQHILALGFGQGVDAIVIKVLRPAGPSVTTALARKKTESHYTRYLSSSGLLAVDFGMRAERDNRSAHSVAWRKHRQLTAFVGGVCRSCETVQFPKSRVCVNPQCRATDTQSDHPLALGCGRVKSFTEDWQAYSPRPPAIYGNVEFEGGGNLLMELTDVDSGDVGVGMRVGFAFRVKDVDTLRGFKRYFWKAVQV